MIKRKYVVLSLLTLVSIVLVGLSCTNITQANSTVTGYVSVSAAAFVSEDSQDKVRNRGRWLDNLETETKLYVGSVQLPHGATVTNVTFYWWDTNYEDLTLKLIRFDYPYVRSMANMTSSGNPGDSFSYDDTIDYATVDNSQYSYYLQVEIPPLYPPDPNPDYSFFYAIIEYTLPSGVGVGGFWIPVNKLGLLAPYIACVSTIILAVSISVAYIKHRKKQ